MYHVVKIKVSQLMDFLSKASTKKRVSVLLAMLVLLSVRTALASSSNDVDLSPLDSSVEGHLQGDWGKLVAYIALGLGVIYAAIKHNYLILMGAIIILLALAFGPSIIDSSLGS